MKLKRIFLTALATSMLVGITTTPAPVEATDFSGQEDKYMKLCSSSNLSSSNLQTCKEFNTYLKEKNQDLKEQVSNSKDQLSQTQASLDSISSEINSLNTQIEEKQKEITYLETSISNLEASIQAKEEEVKERMYAMQSYTNENTFINFIFGASNFTDMFSRIDSFNTLTQSDQDLIEELNAQKAQVEQQQVLLEETKAVLLAQQEEQQALQTKYTALLQEQNNAIAATQNSIYDYGEMTEELSAAIDEFNKNAYEIATPEPPKPSEVPTTPPSNNNDSGSNNGNTDSGSNGDNSNITTDLGQRIYSVAYSKLGSRYYWGASGPNYFDCSGFVYWSLNQAGVSVGRTTAAGYSRMWSSVSFANSQTGDLVCFGSPAYHIGIVIVNSNGTRSMIHAGGGNSSTFGDDPNACVKISSIEPGSYYYSRISTIRHIG